MQGGIINTLFALILAIIIVSIIWGLSLYFAELGSQEGMKEAKAMFLGGVTGLFVVMCIYAVVEWVRAAIGI